MSNATRAIKRNPSKLRVVQEGVTAADIQKYQQQREAERLECAERINQLLADGGFAYKLDAVIGGLNIPLDQIIKCTVMVSLISK